MEAQISVMRFLHLLFPPPCFEKYFYEFDFFNVACSRIVLSKCLGYAIIAGSLLVKIPQIVKIIQAHSGEGIKVSSVTMELGAITATMCYSYAKSFPFSTYGESLFLIIQTSIIGFLVLWYQRKALIAVLYLTIYGALLGYFLSPFIPITLLTFLQSCVIPVVIFSKFLQAHHNYRKKSTGQLSALTVFLLFLGALARVFTSLQETGDTLIVFTYIVSTVVNGVIAVQMVYYWNYSEKKKTD